jgi:Na+/H+ antiporter NhaD/arsenite permease-like protein
VDVDLGSDDPRQGRGGCAVTGRLRTLLPHHALQSLLFERLLLAASGVLALAALATGRVTPAEIPGLMDVRLLSLFFVLTIAVELGKVSNLFDRLVAFVVARVRSARSLAWSMIAVSGALAAILTNDVALFLVVPFTMLFRKATDMDLTALVVLEVLAVNILGCLTPLGNPQNLFLYTRGGFTIGAFLANQAPFVALASVLLAAAVPILVPRRTLASPEAPPFEVHTLLAGACLLLLAAEIASLLGLVHHAAPLLLSLGGVLLLGRKVRDADFSLVFVFAFLFVGIAGLERSSLYRGLDLGHLLGSRAGGLVLSGALLSQLFSNVPTAMLLAPAAATTAGFGALLHGVNAGGCGTPIASLANLIGAQLFAREGGDIRAFWRRFLPVSFALLALLTGASLLLVTL